MRKNRLNGFSFERSLNTRLKLADFIKSAMLVMESFHNASLNSNLDSARRRRDRQEQRGREEYSGHCRTY